MPSIRLFVVLSCLFVVPLSGCMDDGPTAEDPTDEDPVVERPPQDQKDDFAVLPYALGAGPTVDETIWINGTFAIGIGCAPLCPHHDEATPDIHRHDLSEIVPDNLPTRIVLRLVTDAEAELVIELDSRAPRYADRPTEPDDTGGRVVTLVSGPDEPVVAVVRLVKANGTEVSYTLIAEVRAAPGVVPEGVPVEVPVGVPDAGLLFSTTARYGRASFLLYDGDDRLIDRFRTVGGALTFRPEDNITGPYVLVPAAGADGMVVETFGVPPEDPRMRLLALERTPGERVTLGPGTNEWSFDVAGAPLGVGIEVRAVPPAAAASLNVTLTHPDGSMWTWNASCSVCSGAETWVRTWRAPLGDPSIMAGAYDAEVRTDAAVGLDARGVVITYLR
ncbi:MAG: hypothetical protein KY455_04555 [Euryarchaeota archaeon]|nr:hypothetical protein [Euryarchaeota archaeon]